MASSKNLIPFENRTENEQREIRKKGGIASGKSRLEAKLLKEALQKALKGKYEVGEDKVALGGYDALAISMIKQAISGSVSAFKEIRDTIGEKPTDVVSVESEALTGINIQFVNKSKLNAKKEKDPKIIGECTPPSNTQE